jgi:N6-L-threonylcarbamoyladenine synthase
MTVNLDAGLSVLGIETSCDETAAAIVRNGTQVISSVVASELDNHVRFGGVVPEIASRAHVELITPVIAQALVEANIGGDTHPDAVAGVIGPGLVGALLVGVSTAKAMALIWGVPFVGVNHLEAHLYASFLEEPDLELPLVVLLASGGHTMLVLMEGKGRYRILGETLDDAAGEAFDKVARTMGLPYPGGPVIDGLAQKGDPEAIKFPRAVMNQGYDFSFSGVKTAVANYVRNTPDWDEADVAASFQAAVVDALLIKARRAVHEFGAKGIALGGGVAANSQLREQTCDIGIEDGIRVFLPSRQLCTDNAAMVASAGYYRLQSDGPTSLDAGAYPGLKLVSL